jgi:hypothetical protein
MTAAATIASSTSPVHVGAGDCVYDYFTSMNSLSLKKDPPIRDGLSTVDLHDKNGQQLAIVMPTPQVRGAFQADKYNKVTGSWCLANAQRHQLEKIYHRVKSAFTSVDVQWKPLPDTVIWIKAPTGKTHKFVTKHGACSGWDLDYVNSVLISGRVKYAVVLVGCWLNRLNEEDVKGGLYFTLRQLNLEPEKKSLRSSNAFDSDHAEEEEDEE